MLEYGSSKRGGGSDKLYVPMDSLDQLSRYVGGESPTLSRLGGSDWTNTKTKARRAALFLDHGDRVKITVRFRGREISHANLGRDLLMRTAELLAEHGVIERQPLLEGRSMYIVMGPLEKRDRKTEGDGTAPSDTTESTEPPKGGETIGDAIAAKAPPAPAVSPAEATVEAPAAKGS